MCPTTSMNAATLTPALSLEVGETVISEQDHFEGTPRKRRKHNDGSASPVETSNTSRKNGPSEDISTVPTSEINNVKSTSLSDISSIQSVTATDDDLPKSSPGSSTFEQSDVKIELHSLSSDVFDELRCTSSKEEVTSQTPKDNRIPAGSPLQMTPPKHFQESETKDKSVSYTSHLKTTPCRSVSTTIPYVFTEDTSFVSCDNINQISHSKDQAITNTMVQDTETKSLDQQAVTTNSPSNRMLSLEGEDGSITCDKAGASPSARSLRERKASRTIIDDPLDEVMKPLSADERKAFPGWVEVESEPALFEYILKQNGVADVNIQEIYDIETMAGSEKSSHTHGVIFLFQYDDNDAQEWSADAKCPKKIWFANQVVDYACATVALMNIVMNSKTLNLGDYLECFRERTRKMKPMFRGRALGLDDFIRNNHNSFMRRIEMINANLCLQQEHAKHEKAQRQRKPARKATAKQRTKKNNDDDGFHYIAFVPIDGSVWRFDGLLQQPMNIGSYTDDWLSVAQVNIGSRISSGEQTHFNLMVLRDDLLSECKSRAADVIKSIVAVQEKLEELSGEWQALAGGRVRPTEEVMSSCGLRQSDLESAKILDAAATAMTTPSLDNFLLVWHKLFIARNQLESEYMEEISNSAENKDIVDRRLHDLTPDIYHAINTLSQSGNLKEIAMEVVSATAADVRGKDDGGDEEWEVFP